MALLTGLISTLVANGLTTIADVALDKGEDFVKGKIKEVTGIDIGDTLSKEDANKIKLSEAEILSLLTEKNRHSEKLLELALKEEELDASDRANARELNKTYIESDDKFISRFIPILSIVLIISGFIFLYCLVFWDIPKENQHTATNVVNLIGYIITSIVMFFTGKHSSGNTTIKV
jgi:hypothetical protein